MPILDNMPTLEQYIEFYKFVSGNNKNTSDVISNIKRIGNLAGNNTLVSWIETEISSKQGNVSNVTNSFEVLLNNNTSTPLLNPDTYKSALKKFTTVVLGFFSADVWLGHDIILCQLIADNAIFASREVVELVKRGKLGTQDNVKFGGNRFASWDYMYRIRDIKHKRQVLNDISVCSEYPQASSTIKADDNTYANIYIKKAVAESFNRKFGGLPQSKWSLFNGTYEACHIWGASGACYTHDRRYYASIANLVLLPRSLAGLTDHNQDVISLLQYEAWRRFNKFKPDPERAPKRPSFYSRIKWRFPKEKW